MVTDDLALASLKFFESDSHGDRFQASREEIEDILRWIEGSDGMRFFWINGAAEVGKSMLIHRLLEYIKGEGILITFAYFSLGNSIDPKDLVRGMAHELSSLHPGCRPAIAHAIYECSGQHQALDEYSFSPVRPTNHLYSPRPPFFKNPPPSVSVHNRCIHHASRGPGI